MDATLVASFERRKVPDANINKYIRSDLRERPGKSSSRSRQKVGVDRNLCVWLVFDAKLLSSSSCVGLCRSTGPLIVSLPPAFLVSSGQGAAAPFTACSRVTLGLTRTGRMTEFVVGVAADAHAIVHNTGASRLRSLGRLSRVWMRPEVGENIGDRVAPSGLLPPPQCN